MKKSTALIIGGGAFGTSLASVASHNFDQVIVKVRSLDVYEGLKNHENSVYLKGQILPKEIKPALTWEEVDDYLKESKLELIISGLPTSAIKSYYSENAERFFNYLSNNIPLISLAKGMDTDTLELPDDLFLKYFGKYQDQICFLSGPSFAAEIIEQQITLVSLAGRSRSVLMNVTKMMETPYFKIFPNYDVKGVLLGGALKNVLAIAGGTIEGLGFNHNTRAAMITRGIIEMLRFGKVFNARPETFYGLSGMGDLILTTTGRLSRNKQFGMEIAKGRSPIEIINSQRSVVEGYKTARAVHELSKKYEIRARIFNSVYSVLYEDKTPQEMIADLMQTPPKFEID